MDGEEVNIQKEYDYISGIYESWKNNPLTDEEIGFYYFSRSVIYRERAKLEKGATRLNSKAANSLSRTITYLKDAFS